jgi:hypothetical protein
MKSEEINKIIAEFMGGELSTRGMCDKPCIRFAYGNPDDFINAEVIHDLYTESVDNLIPVWKEMYAKYGALSKVDQLVSSVGAGIMLDKSPTKTAALSTAMHIKLLKEVKE